MLNKIFDIIQLSITYNSLDAKRLDNNIRDFINCTSLGIFSDMELDESRFFTKSINDNLLITYVIIDSPIKSLKFDTAMRMSNNHIIIYRYNNELSTDEKILCTLKKEIEYILTAIYNNEYTKLDYNNFNNLNSKQKLLLLAPCIIITKIFGRIDIGLFTDGEYTLQKTLNPNNYTQINEIIKFITIEQPSIDTLFNLNGFLLPFKIKE